MCGIAGYFGQGSQEELTKMTNSLEHRGPDSFGFYVNDVIGFGHRRLSIIDMTSVANQPMEDDKSIVVFNGEIYNFQSIKEQGIKDGYKFKSHSDTEAILYLYGKYGTDCFAKLNGMFAIAIFDKAKKIIILSRDRLGKKPLYWSVNGNTLFFASELKGLMPHRYFKKEIDFLSFNKYLTFDYIPTPNTVFKNVFKMEPGHCLVFDGREIKKNKFWTLNFKTHSFTDDNSEKSILTQLDQSLEKAVTSRLVADVPLGVFLSGGLDSSTIAYYAQKNNTSKMKTFSIGFDEKDCDESAYARQVSEHLHTDHYEEKLDSKLALDLIVRMGDFIDEPVADYSFVPTYLLSKFTKKHVTVALSGDGGDELFFGYPTFQAESFVKICRLFPQGVFNVLQKIPAILPGKDKNYNLSFKLERFLRGCREPLERRHHSWMGPFGQEERLKLLSSSQNSFSTDMIFNEISNYFSEVKSEELFNKLSYLYLRTYLMDQVLVKVDRMSMANALEVRSPFLDYEFVELISSVPMSHKKHSLKLKYLLKKMMEGKLPENIINRKKQGFGIPLSVWLKTDLKDFVLDILSEKNINESGFFKYDFVAKILNDHFVGKKDNRKQIWSILVWQMWYNKWCK